MPKKFAFSLEALLRIRDVREMERKRDLAIATRVFVQATERFNEIVEEGKQAENDFRRKLSGPVSVVDLILAENYRNRIARNMIAQSVEVSKSYQGRMKAIDDLVEARKQKRVVEVLREHKYKQWVADLLKEEAAVLDEVANRGKRYNA